MANEIKHTADFLRELRSNGRFAFTLEDIVSKTRKPIQNIRKDIDRLREKGKILNIRRGFFILIPEEYSKMKGVPVELYLDDLMKYLSKPYYAGLYSAAMFHGASHQQPQEFFVITASPKTRKIKCRNTLINFSEKRHFPAAGIEMRKTDTGYLNISGRELTFLDLIYYEHTAGGFNRMTTILSELSEDISLSRMKEAVGNVYPAAVFQRAGYIAEQVLRKGRLADVFEKKLSTLKFQTAFLKASGQKSGTRNGKWGLIINMQIAADL